MTIGRYRDAFAAAVTSMITIGLILVIGAACSGAGSSGESDDPPVATPTTEDLAALVDTAASALVMQEGFHFELEDLGRQTFVSPELVLVWARGDVRVPGAVRGFLGLGAVGAPAAPLETEIRVIDGQAYATNPLSGTWIRANAAELPVKLDSLEEKIRALITGVQSLEYQGKVRIEARDGTAIRGVIAASAFGILFEGAIEDEAASVEVEVVILDSDGLPYRIEIVGPMLHSDDETARRMLTLSEFGRVDEFGVPEGL